MAATAGKDALIKVSGSATGFTDEATTNAGDDQTYQITNTAKRVWDRTATITVEDDGVPTVEGYSINRLTGTVTFDAADAGRGTVTVTGDYLPLSTAAQAKSHTLSIIAATYSVGKYADDWDEVIQGLLRVSGLLTEWTTTDTTFMSAIVAGDPVVLEIYENASNDPTKAWAILSQTDIRGVIDGAVETSISWQGSADTDGNAIALP